MRRRTFRFRRVLSAVLSLYLALSGAGAAFAADSENDWSGHWAEEQLQSWLDQGLLNGYEDGSLKPDQSVTRAEFIAMVNRSFGLNKKGQVIAKDIAPESWAFDVFAVALEAGYIHGYADGTMRPDQLISRQEAAVVIANLLQFDLSSTSANEPWAEQMPDWSRGAWSAVSAAGFIPFYTNDATSFDKPITRAEAVSILDAAKKEKIVTYDQPGTYGPESTV